MISNIAHWVWHFLQDLGVNAQTQYRLRLLTHRLHLRDDDLVRAFDQVDAIVARSQDVLEKLNLQESSDQNPVLVWTVRGGLVVNLTEALLAQAIQLRGTKVQMVICDKFLPACEGRNIILYPNKKVNQRATKQICDRCFFLSQSLFDRFQLPYTLLSTWIDQEVVKQIKATAQSLNRQQIFELKYKGVHLGPIIQSSVVRFFQHVHLLDDAQTGEMVQNYAAAAMILTDIIGCVLDKLQPRALLTSHGIYITWGITTEMAKGREIPITVWGQGHRKSTVHFSHGGTYYEEMIAEPEDHWKDLEMIEERRQRLENYLNNRWKRNSDRMVLYPKAIEDVAQMLQTLALDSNKPTLGLFPNVPWDAQIYHRNIAFPDIFKWILQTISFYLNHPEWQLVIRTHPMENWLSGGAQQTVISEIQQHFHKLPPNIKIIPPDSPISSYLLAKFIQVGVVHATQFGLEMACQGKPVIVTGGPPYRGKGFTYDVQTAEEYVSLLNHFGQLSPLNQEQIERAHKYAYHLYFRRMIPFPLIEDGGFAGGGFKNLRLDGLHDLLPERNPYLDRIVDGILNNQPIFAEF